MKKLNQLILIAGLGLSLNGFAVGVTVTSCQHAGIDYSFGGTGTCPEYRGTDANHPSTWTHVHSGDNNDAYFILPDNSILREGSPEHCEVAKKQTFEDTGL